MFFRKRKTILEMITESLIDALPMFKILNPGVPSMFPGKWAKRFFKGVSYGKSARRVINGKPLDIELGEMFGRKIVPLHILKKITSKGHSIVMTDRSVYKRSRTLFDHYADSYNGRTIREVNIVYHKANKAKDHVDAHFGHCSIVRKISEAIKKDIKFTKKGELTAESKRIIFNDFKKSLENGVNLPQNWDHTIAGARETWLVGQQRKSKDTYGAGDTRQPVFRGLCEIVSTSKKPGNMKIYAPGINDKELIYVRQIYPGSETKAPILSCGYKRNYPPEFYDKPHFKSVDPTDLISFVRSIRDKDFSIAEKHDGASVHFVIGNRYTTLYSPRFSIEDGKRINYIKFAEMSRAKSDKKFVGMGELILSRKYPFFKKRISAAKIGGELNKRGVLPRNIIPELKIYRIDEYDGMYVKDIPYIENIKLQQEASETHKQFSTVRDGMISLMPEGLIICPDVHNMRVDDCVKVKFIEDPQDWKVESVNLGISPKGYVDGVVWFKSTDSNRRFKLGPGQIGSRENCLEIMNNPDKFIGRVAKVASRHGHEGRAAKLTEWHLDK